MRRMLCGGLLLILVLVGQAAAGPLTALPAVLAGIVGSYTTVWAYDATGGWSYYDLSDIRGSLFTQFAAGRGYWIKTTGATTWALPQCTIGKKMERLSRRYP